MKHFVTIGAIGLIAAAVAGCTPDDGAEVISKTEAEVLSGNTEAPAPPVAVAGPVDPVNSLNGNYNLRVTECGQAASEGSLAIQGNRFQFYESQCTAIKSTTNADATETQLSCSGEGQGFNRLVKLRLSPGTLQVEDSGVNLHYFRCPAA